jgi:hypothetical protein
MWWEPESESDRRVRETIDRLSGLLREGVPILPVVPNTAIHGIGSILVAPDERRLLLLLDSHWDFGVGTRIRMLFDGPWYPTPLWRLGFRPLIECVFPLYQTRSISPKDWTNVPWDCVVRFSPPPIPASGGTLLRSGKDRGSVGIAVEIKDLANQRRLTGFTTAGHVVVGGRVQRAFRAFGLFRRFFAPDDVILSTDCTRDAEAEGFDIAVVECGENLAGVPRLSAAGVVGANEIEKMRECMMWGGNSGMRQGFAGCPINTFPPWTNCWMVTGRGGWFAKKADSGAPVTMWDGRIMGHLVGVDGYGGEHGRQEAGYVQDISSQLAHLQNKFKVTLA